MRLSVKCLVASGNAAALPDSDATIKEIDMANPQATVKSFRAAIAVQFKIQVFGFVMSAVKSDGTAVDFSDESVRLADCGLTEETEVTVSSKRARPPASTGGAPVPATATSPGTDDPPASRARVEVTPSSPGTVSGGEDAASEGEEDEDDEGEEFDLGEVLAGLSDGEDDGKDGSSGADLYTRLMETVPDLVAMRQRFLENPETMMQRIQTEDPTLFQLITANQQKFLDLVNDEEMVQLLQDDADAMEEGSGMDDEELDEEQLEVVQNAIMQMLAQSQNATESDLNALGDLRPEGEAAVDETDQERILAFTPSDEDEAKIQELTQLGFTYKQCKVAFYISRRSIERAANLLFENPPKL